MTPQQRIIALVATVALATMVAAILLTALRRAVDRWGKVLTMNQEKALVKEPQPLPRPRAELTFELVPQDEATSLLMGTVSNTGDVPLESLTLSSSMERMIFSVENFAYVDEVHLLRESGELHLTPGSSTKLCLGSVKLMARLDSEYLSKVKRSPSPTLTITLATPSPSVEMEEGNAVEDEGEAAPYTHEEKGGEKKPREKPIRGEKKEKLSAEDRRRERDRKKAEQRRERDRKKIEREEKKARGKKSVESAEKAVNAPSKGTSPSVPTPAPTQRPEPLSATFSIPLHRGVFPQADAQMLYFYRRDLLFERADTKGEVFKNTMTFDGAPTRNLYRPRSGK